MCLNLNTFCAKCWPNNLTGRTFFLICFLQVLLLFCFVLFYDNLFAGKFLLNFTFPHTVHLMVEFCNWFERKKSLYLCTQKKLLYNKNEDKNHWIKTLESSTRNYYLKWSAANTRKDGIFVREVTKILGWIKYFHRSKYLIWILEATIHSKKRTWMT